MTHSISCSRWAAIPLTMLIAAGIASPASAVGTTVSTAGPTSSSLSEAGDQSFDDLAACAVDHENFLAAIVVDESGSLINTDPDGSRVQAITTVIDSLSSLADSSDGKVNVEASLATFGMEYKEQVGWATVDSNPDSELRTAANALGDKNQAKYTNYEAALEGAQDSLDQRESEFAAAGKGDSCKVTLMFTDGKLDLDNNDDGEPMPKTNAARVDLCGASTEDGPDVIDKVRKDSIFVIALALFTDDGPGRVDPADRDQLQAVAEGKANGVTCGQPIGDDAQAGAFLSANDSASLNFVFAGVGARIEGGTDGGATTCPGAGCVDGLLPIPVDAGIGAVRVTIDRALSDQHATLIAPDDESSVALTGTASTSLAKANVEVSSGEGLSTVDIEFPGSGSPGDEWELDLGTDSTTNAELYYFWGADLTVTASDEPLVGGKNSTLTFSLAVPGGEPGAVIDPSDYTTFNIDAKVNDEPVSVENVDGTYQATYPVEEPDSDEPLDIIVKAKATATTDPSGHQFTTKETADTVASVLRPVYANMVPAQLDFPPIVGSEPTRANIRFDGSVKGPTKACFAFDDQSVPPDAGKVTPSIPSANAKGCVDIPENESTVVEVMLNPASKARGWVKGALTVTRTSAVSDESVTSTVPYSAEMESPVNEQERWGFTAALVLLALIVAWVTAEIARRLSDTFRIGNGTQYAAMDVKLVGSQLSRADGVQGPLLDPAKDFRPVGSIGSGGRKSKFAVDALHFTRHFPKWPLNAGTGEVSAPSRIVVAGPHGDLLAPDGSRAQAPFPGTTGFQVVVDPSGISPEQIAARLIMIIDAPTGVADVLPDRLDELKSAQWENITELIRTAGDELTGPADEASTPDAAGPADGSPHGDMFATTATPGTSETPPMTSMFDDQPGVGGAAPIQEAPRDRKGRPPKPAKAAKPTKRGKPRKRTNKSEVSDDSGSTPPPRPPSENDGLPPAPNLFD